MTKIMGPQDFSGQESSDGTRDTPAEEGNESRDVGKIRTEGPPRMGGTERIQSADIEQRLGDSRH